MTFADEATSPLWFFHPLMGVVSKGLSHSFENRDCFVTPLRSVPRNDGVEVSLRGRAFYLFRLEAASRRRGEWQSPFPSSVIARPCLLRPWQSRRSHHHVIAKEVKQSQYNPLSHCEEA